MLHLSGHGEAGAVLLERPDGSADELSSDELVELLYPMRRRLRLVVVSACESGAATAAETLRQLDLGEQAAPLEAQADAEAGVAATGASAPAATTPTAAAPGATNLTGREPPAGWPGVGRALAERLGCAVLAMRYPVIDEFAIELTGQLVPGAVRARPAARRGAAARTAAGRSAAALARRAPGGAHHSSAARPGGRAAAGPAVRRGALQRGDGGLCAFRVSKFTAP